GFFPGWTCSHRTYGSESTSAGSSSGTAAPAKLPLRIDYRKFRNAYGGDWAARLRVLALPECALTTPDAPQCAGVRVPSRNDTEAGVVTATASLSGASTLMALSAGESSAAGDYSATPIAPSSTWEAGGSTGDFNWNYPLRTPPALGGAAPKVAFGYSSQSVDGRTSATNNQPSMLGEGFSYSPGYVERRFKACMDDMSDEATNKKKTGDLCQSGGAENIVLSLDGSNVELLYNNSDKRWHPKKDDGTKIERLTDASFANGDDNNEYWKAITADGVQYVFGRNRLPGWSANKQETKSVWTTPVAGNNPGETCYNAEFVDSFCDEAWRWNLDYVVDTNGNTTSYWYDPETNYYGRNNDATKRTKYTRGGMLSRIDYGTRADNIFGTAPAQVIFEPGNRCSTTTDCDATVKENWKNWLDTPLDKGCKEGTDCKDNFAPTFWSMKRLAKVTTQVWGGSAYRKVDEWALRATWPEPADGLHAGMWLAGITHTGLADGTIRLPETVLTGTRMENRVDRTGDNISAYAWLRLTSVKSETGGLTSIFYQDPECVAGVKVPTDPDSNTLRCYPVKWQPDGFPAPKLDYFHKYVVRAVTETDLTGGSPPVKVKYEYLGTPAWHRDEDDGLVKKSNLSWGQWRGYGAVRVLRGEEGEQTRKETSYFRGMDGDTLADGTKREVTLPAIDRSPAIADSEAFAGMIREDRSYSGDTLIAATVSTPWQSEPTATRTINKIVTDARYINVAATRTRTWLPHSSTWRRVSKTMKYDGYGMLTEVDDAGDEAVVGTDTVAGDESCVKNTYARNETTWIMDRTSKVETYARPCGTAPKSADDVKGITRNFYDNSLTAGAAPTGPGNPTRVETLATWSTTSQTYLAQQRAHYDAYGRADQTWDLAGAKKTMTFGTVSGGGVNSVTTTLVADSKVYTTSAEIDPAWGVTTATVDMNSNRTDVKYDALGRTAEVWKPGRSRSAGANAVFSYVMRNDGVVSTKSMSLNAVGKYTTSYTIFDSLLRQREKQSDSPTAGSRIVTETRYDSAGRKVLELGPVVNGARPDGRLSSLAADLVYPQSRTDYDAAGRVAATVFQPRGVEKWRTSKYYGGDREATTPPTGGTASTVIHDASGHTTDLIQYAPGTESSAGTTTSYAYNRKGELIKVTDPDGNKWEYRRDLRGRLVYTKDPDKGEVNYTYDTVDRMSTATDARGAASALKYTYDMLSRKTGVFDKATNAKRATWAYDTAPGGKGAVASSSRWIGTDEYKNAVRGYSPRGLTTGTTTTLPASEGALAGSYTFIVGYNDATDGSLAGYTYGGRADLMAETIFYNYHPDTGMPYSVDSDYTGTNAYVKSTSYSGIGQPTGFVLTTDKRETAETYRDYVYDPTTGRLDHSVTSSTAKGVISQPHYTYDGAGNVTSISDPFSGNEAADNQCFSQDHLQRLTEAWTPADGDCDPAKRANDKLGGPAPYWQSWTYDDVGNRLTQTDHATPSGDAVTNYHPVPGKHALASTDGALTGTYGYDEIGNLKRRPTGTGDQVLNWDAEGRLGSIVDGANTTSFVYDAGGTRLLRKETNAVTVYLGDVEVRLNKITGLLNETRSYKWADQVVAVRTAAGVVWMVNDHQGTANILVSADGKKVTRRFQTPFGGSRGAVPLWPTQRGYAGGQQDPTGLVHLGAREYDPLTGRFVSVDPLLDNANPQQMHGYSYASNSPISSCDPDGEMLITDAGGPGTTSPTPPPADDRGGKDWWRKYSVPHDMAIDERVKQIKQKWPKARKITISRKDNFIREGSSKSPKSTEAGYADLICWDCDAGTIYVWEMKHKGGGAEAAGPAQLTKYVTKLQAMVDEPKHAEHGKTVEKGPKFGKAMDTTFINPQNGKETLVEDGTAAGIQVYSWDDDEKESASPSPTATSTPTAAATPEPGSTDNPNFRVRTNPSPSTRAPEPPSSDGIKIGAPDAETVMAAVAVVVVVAVVVAIAVAAAPVVIAAVGAACAAIALSFAFS
ncbi:RHS repeat-associated core domain-containing protein, partial [Actinoplanes sp. NPDC005259]|uniref:RHS repeat domain-containing protein n=1 Tax=Actinoplanes sp. NPDC005259 TaxID=3154674 RepID=UPI0033B170E7